MLPNFAFVVDGPDGTLTFNSVVDFSLAVDDRFGLIGLPYTEGQAHSFDLDIEQNTQLVTITDSVSGESVLRVDSGSVSASGTGDLAGTADAMVGQCFTLDLSGLLADPPFFPMAAAACPT
jgi:hypothetical protein